MAKFEDNNSPYITFVETAAPATPAAGKQKVFIDPADHKLKRKDESGAITIIGSEQSGIFALSGDISPAQITSDQNDYNPTGLSTAAVLRLNSDASRDITGLQGGADGRIIAIYNTGSQNIVLKDASGSSSAANRFELQVDITLAGGDGCLLIYDSTSSVWRCIGKTPGGSASSTFAPWLVDIIPMISEPSATTGTWTLTGGFSEAVTYPFGRNYATGNNVPVALISAAQNDAISWKIVLSAGTWDIHLHVRKSTNTGIFTVKIDGASVGTADSYAAAAAYGKISVTGVSVASDGVKTLQLLMATKNASSSGYLGELFGISLRRTA